MLTFAFKRFMSESSHAGNDLNRKILEAFTSIIDKGSKLSAARSENIIEPIPQYNVESKLSVSKIQDYKPNLYTESVSEPLLIRNPPDIFRRSKQSPDFLHKVDIKLSDR